jgi:hypothetical protein
LMFSMVIAASALEIPHHTTAFEDQIFRARLACIVLSVDTTQHTPGNERSKHLQDATGAR